MVENNRFYALKLQIAFPEALYDFIRTDLRRNEALQSLQIESRHLLDHCWKSVIENVRFYALKLQIHVAFSEALYGSTIRTDLRLIEALNLQSLQIET